MVVRVTANLGDTTPSSASFPGGAAAGAGAYFTRRHRFPVRRAMLDWIATAERPLAVVPAGGGVYNGAQYRGLRFERKVTDAFAERYGAGWLAQPVFRFLAGADGPSYASRAVPDGILYSAGEILVVEIKFNFRREDLGQLEDFYLPVVRKAFPRHFVSGMIACKNLLEYRCVKPFQVLYDTTDLNSLRARRFTQYLLVGRGGIPLRGLS